MQNEALYERVRRLYEIACGNVMSEGPDVHSGEFLDSFPRAFIRLGQARESGCEAEVHDAVTSALEGDFKERGETALQIFTDRRQGAHEDAMRVVLEDFLNDAVPRCIGLSSEADRFDKLYRRFEHDLYANTFTLETLALLEGARDHGANTHPTAEGVAFKWASRPMGQANHPAARDSAVDYFHLKKGARTLGSGRSLADANSFFFMIAEEEIPKAGATRSTISTRSTDVTRKVVFLLRLLSRIAVYSDYRGSRTLGHLAPFNFYFMNWPDEAVAHPGEVSLTLLEPAFHVSLGPMLATSYSSIEMIARKLDDAFRRHKSSFMDPDRAEDQVSIDRLLDYVQILEGILPTNASYKVWMWASALLGFHLKDDGRRSQQVYDCLNVHYKKRDDVVHGRVHNVRARDLDLGSLRDIVHELAILKILNRGRDLSDVAQELLLRRPAADIQLTELIGRFLERQRSI